MSERPEPTQEKIDEALSKAKAQANKVSSERRLPVELHVFLSYSATTLDPYPAIYPIPKREKIKPEDVYLGTVASDPLS